MKHVMKRILAAAMAAFILVSTNAFVQSADAASASSAAGIVSTSSGYLNVRSGAGTSYAVVTQLARGSYVTLISKTGSWWKVEYARDAYGYVSASYITGVSSAAKTVRLSSGTLNVRSGPGTTYSVVSTLSAGKTVLVLSVSGNWSRILYDGTKLGYVSSSYLADAGAPAASMLWPVPASRGINQYYRSGTHFGIDIAPAVRGVPGDRVNAALGGTVAYSGWLSGYGYVAYINSYSNGRYLQLRYAHLASAPAVRAGQTVAAGQTVGAMGNTGTSSGVHLHFEVRVRGSAAECIANSQSTPVDPMSYLS